MFQVSVNTGAANGCQWTASTSDAWIHLVGSTSGQGAGVVAMAVDSSLFSPVRHGMVSVSWTGGNTSITVDQAAGCDLTRTVNLSSERQAYDLNVGVSCAAAASAARLPGAVDVPWIQFYESHDSLTHLVYTVDRNTGPERVGHITTGVGQVTIIQAAGGASNCVTAIAPTSQAFDEDGGTGTITVTAPPGCYWEAVAHSTNTIALTVLSGGTGIGNGLVTFRMGDNTSLVGRSGYLLIGGTQLFQITQSACLATVSPLNVHVPAGGGNFFVTVSASRTFCSWGDYSNDQFITRPFESRTGPGTVEFSVAPNHSGQARSGSLFVVDQTVVVTQEP